MTMVLQLLDFFGNLDMFHLSAIHFLRPISAPHLLCCAFLGFPQSQHLCILVFLFYRCVINSLCKVVLESLLSFVVVIGAKEATPWSNDLDNQI